MIFLKKDGVGVRVCRGVIIIMTPAQWIEGGVIEAHQGSRSAPWGNNPM